ncbi:aggregation-promoting factor C-terminal-like domain-containing protein [Solicola gregarius]|uniref:Lytic transglycosylase domain-containing protein n=1 Tax=Solicola gregarius TaxID=2908642 RepID=A0AA46TJH3_9ACTN|nr:lytic transglycosylase domain-containing protein [Solicola gregarius]UYM06258.1 lytic transglycosylase domain-containing protein [Solicola gregarius]
MSRGRPKGGAHAARHRKPSTFERTVGRAIDATPQVSGKSVALAAVGGVLATGTVVGSQALTGDPAAQVAADDTPTALPNVASANGAWDDLDGGSDAAALSARSDDGEVSRSAGRPSLDSLKQESMAEESAVSKGGRAASAKVEVEAADPQDIARSMLGEYGWGEDQFPCLDDLWIGESQWQFDAENPYSGAYGIPQALPAEKMASAGSDWETNPATQIEWGLGYIADRYGSPCAANDFKQGNNWY